MMDQRISIRIAEREYDLKSNSPEEEERIRKSAMQLNRMIDSYQRSYAGRDMIDILSFVALNQGMSNVMLMQRIENIEHECNELQAGIEGYLDNI